MHDAVPSCFRGGSAEAAPPACTKARPRVTTSVYETRHGVAGALTWYRTALGLSLHVDLLLPSPAASPSCFSTSSVISSAGSSDWKNGTVRFRLRPWLLWKRRGTKRFYLKGGEHQERSSHRTVVDFAWDLARARFSPGGGPEPAARFFVAVAVDGEMFLVVGDMEAEAHRKTTPAVKHSIPSLCSATLVSRTEHAVLPSSGRSSYTTRASLGGKEREICIDLGGEEGERDAKLRVALDGGRVLDVKRLQWKFRGSEEVEVDGGGARVQVSWDVHRWLFGRRLCPLPPASAAAISSSEPGHAVLLLRFDREEPEVEEGDVEACVGKHRRGGGGGGSCIPRVGIGEGMVGSLFSGGAVEVSRKSGRTRSLLKTRSSSSSSSASSGSGSSVMEWASAEDVDLQGSDTFSLVVNLWKG